MSQSNSYFNQEIKTLSQTINSAIQCTTTLEHNLRKYSLDNNLPKAPNSHTQVPNLLKLTKFSTKYKRTPKFFFWQERTPKFVLSFFFGQMTDENKIK